MNTYQYNRFDKTKAQFKRLGRNTNEVLLFHGTDPKNVHA
jgi:hypothetical protein